MSMEVRIITAADAKPWVEEIHYARRKVGAVHRFGLFEAAASINPPGWTCWRRAVWLGLLTA